MKFQAGGFALGLVAGLLIGLALALGVALYITKVPVPFIDKLPQRSAADDSAEAERNKTWNPNAPLTTGGTVVPVTPAASGAPGAASPAAVAGQAPARDPAAILSGAAGTSQAAAPSTDPGADPFTYFIQVGAFRRAEDAETQRAALAMQGLSARITEREQAGRTVYRVRLGPFVTRDEAEGIRKRAVSAGFDGQLVRVQKT